MQIVIRADASRDLGTGHVMRCLTLLQTLSAQALFVSTRTEGHLGDLVVANGHQVHLLDAQLSVAEDAAQTAGLAQNADLVIVDHYKLDAGWEAQMPCPVMAIDDLADRPHACAVLLDQNLGRTDTDYDGLIPEECLRLTGPRYALLRDEFGAARAAAMIARKARTGPIRNLMIAMGGTDAPNATGWVLDVLNDMTLPERLEITAILGATAPHIDTVRTALSALPCTSRLLVGANNMGELMAQTDLAVGAAGSTSWERCALGVPTVIVVLADNQISGAQALVSEGAARQVTLREVGPMQDALLELMYEDDARAKMALAAANVCDGAGAQRVANALRTTLAQEQTQ